MKLMKSLLIVACLTGSFTLFTWMRLGGYLGEASYITLFVVLAACTLAVFFADRVKEVNLLGKAAIKLFQINRAGLTVDKLALDVGKILTQFSQHATGSAKQRSEREAMIDDLLKSAKARKQEREQILEDAKLITKMMSTEDEVELQKLKAEIERRGLFD